MKQRNIYRIQLNLQHETGNETEKYIRRIQLNLQHETRNETEKYIQDTAEFTTRNWE